MKSNSLDIENKTTPNTLGFEIDESKYAILFRRNFIRLFLTYVLPLFLLTLFFLFEYNRIIKESLHLHLKSIVLLMVPFVYLILFVDQLLILK
ncbi:MAG: hypothetical protein ACK42G_08870 [Candidatus Kapaibacteriota bacterium]